VLTDVEIAFARQISELGMVALEALLPHIAARGADPRGPDLRQRLLNADLITPEEADDAAAAAAGKPRAEGLRGRRYVVGRELGKGANGIVHLAGDQRLGRSVAMKMSNKGRDCDDVELLRFAHEAQVTGQLAHPSIVPVHDLGVLPDGRPYYTMKRIEGETLKQVFDDLKKDVGERDEIWTVPHTMSVLLRVAQALAFAHDRGVVHRDLKPANVMTADYGEVLLLDWGVARVLGEAAPGVEEVATWRSVGEEDKTVHGTIAGTPAYMAPEQARGEIDRIGPPTDVWSFGILLYEFLVGRRPFRAKTVRELLEKVASEEIVAPSLTKCRVPVPTELEDLLLQCLEREPHDRFASGRELADAIEAWLEGSKRREQAEVLTRRAAGKAAAHAHAAEAAASKEAELTAGEATLPPWAEPEQRRQLWDLEQSWRNLRSLRDDTYDEAVALFQAALEREPDSEDARSGLASLYLRRMDESLQRGERGAARFFRSQVLRYDTGLLRRILVGASRLNLAGDPVGAEVVLRRVAPRGRQLVADDGRPIGTLPLQDVALSSGSWLVEILAPGRQAVRISVFADRPRMLSFDVSLPGLDLVADGFRYVPAGPFLAGGDPRALDGEPREERRLDAFGIGRFPVTVREFQEFLTDGGTAQGHHCWTGPPSIPRDVVGELPALGVSYLGAAAYARWLSARTGRRFRLPRHDEWEKAARGADGRTFPWGDLWEPSFCNAPDAVPGEPSPEAVGSRPEDCSVYGVRDLAGGVHEWVESDVAHRPELGEVRGGSWNGHPQMARLCSRARRPRAGRGGTIGLRLLQEL